MGLVDVEIKGSEVNGNANTPGLGPRQALVAQTTPGMVVNPITPKAPSLPTESWDYQATPVTIREVHIIIIEDYLTHALSPPFSLCISPSFATFYLTLSLTSLRIP